MRSTNSAKPTRRDLLRVAGAVGVAAPLAGVGVGLAGGFPAPAIASSLKPIRYAVNASALCLAPAFVAKERGIFERYGLDVEFVNFGASTETLLEAIATGKAEGGAQPGQGGVVCRVEAGVEMQGHKLGGTGYDALAGPHDPQKHHAVHATRNRDADARPRNEAPGVHEQLSGLGDAELLGVGRILVLEAQIVRDGSFRRILGVHASGLLPAS